MPSVRLTNRIIFYYQELRDRDGMLFWSQSSAHIWYDTDAFRSNFKKMLIRYIKERRNSPSIILWGLQNESALPKDFAEECSAIIREWILHVVTNVQ